jgi:hypothetical protein
VSTGVLWALVSTTWREKLSRPIVVVLCVLLCVVQSAVAISASRDLSDPAFILAMVLGAGSVGRDVSSGVLALILTRPIVRTTYILAKWLAVGGAAAILSLLTLVAQTLLLRGKGIDISIGELLSAMFGATTSAFGVTSVLVLLSVLIPGVGDIATWVALGLVGYLGRNALPQRFSEEWRGFLQPSLEWSSTFGATPISWFALSSYLSTVTLCLCLAALALNRKEVSYASG